MTALLFCYNAAMSESMTRTFRPDLLPRRTEFSTWGMTILIVAALGYLNFAQGFTAPWMWIFSAVMLFASLSISLGNWMDRRTILTLGVAGVAFENGLRSVNMSWDEIQTITVRPTRWGRAVHVIGRGSHFGFYTLGKMEFQGRVQGSTGFADGQEILDEMIRSAQLLRSSVEGQVYSYSRA